MSDQGKPVDDSNEQPRAARPASPVKVLLLFVVALGALYYVAGNLPHDVVPPAVSWRVDAHAAASQASSSGKVIFADFYADWCEPCREMDHDVFSDKRFAAALEKSAVPLRVDITQKPGQQMAMQYGVEEIPTFIVLAPDGKPLSRRTGMMTAAELLAMVQKTAAKAGQQ